MTIEKPILGNKLTPEQRLAILESLKVDARSLMEYLRSHAENRVYRMAEKLTDSELLMLSYGGVQMTRLCRTLLQAEVFDWLKKQYDCEAIKLDTKRAKRFLKHRQ